MLRTRFKEFGQWEVTLQDSNCPWDWDHIYPSAYRRWDVNDAYKDWHDAIGNFRAIGLSENRGDGCDWPTIKLADEMTHFGGGDNPTPSFITGEIWQEIQGIPYSNNALKNDQTALKMCAVVLKRMVSIYSEWHGQLRIGHLMDEIHISAIAPRDGHPPAEHQTEPKDLST